MKHYLFTLFAAIAITANCYSQIDLAPEISPEPIPDLSSLFSFQQPENNIIEKVDAGQQISALGKIPMNYRRFYSLVNNQFNGEYLFDNDTLTKYSAGGGLLYKNFEAYYEFPDEMNVMVNKLRLFDDKHNYLDHPLTISIIRRANAAQWTRENIGVFDGSLREAWQEITLSSPKDIKYIVFTGGQWDNWPTELEVVGSYTPFDDVVPALPKKKFKNYFGVNVYEWNLLQDDVHPFVGWQVYEPKWDIIKHYTHYRHYIDWGQIEGDEGRYSFQPTRMGAWYYDVFYERMSSGGRTITPCIKALPTWMEATWPADKLNHENTPVKYPLSFDSVNSYLPIARTYFQFAARYGSTVVDHSLLNVYSPPGYAPQVKKSGLGYIKVMEAENERDKWWLGIQGYQNGRQYAAFLSAIYDGHMGTMGKGVGLKAADPTMKLIIGGTANPLPDYARGIIDWCKQYRKDSLPFDSFTYHDYASNGSPLQFNADATRSAAPELSSLSKNADNYIFTVNAFAKNKGRGLINSEFGIDIDASSPMKAVAIGNRTVLQTQGDWTIRTILLYARKRLDRIYNFQFFDNIENSPGLFGTTGVANTDLTKRPVLDYVEQLNKLLGEYEYDQTISTRPEVDKYTLGDSVKYVLWMGTESGAVSTYNFKLSNPANKVKIYELVDGQSDMLQSYATITSGVASIQVTETPKIIEEVSTAQVFGPPVVNAGEDQVITLPVTEIKLSGEGSSPAGSVTFFWTKISAPVELGSKMVAPYQKQTDVIRLSQGVYVYQLKVTDVTGKTAADTVVITVQNAAGNLPPVARAGQDTIIIFPTTSFELNGTASSDPDGKIVKYKWKKISGPSWGVLQNPDAARMMCFYAEPGSVYMFDLMVTDDKGASSTDRKVVITLKAGQTAPPNLNAGKPPVANAGKDIAVVTGNNPALDGSKSTAAEGYLVSRFWWSKISGPANYSLTSPGLNATTLSGLQAGVYIFRLTVTDDKGASSTDDVTVTVIQGKGGLPTPSEETRLIVADAGKDEIVPPGQATVLNGENSSSSGAIVTAYKWTKISGPAKIEMLSPDFSTTWIRNMESGTYVFRLSITDSYGATASDDVSVTVTGGSNSIPVAKAGSDQTIILPVNSVTVSNSGSYDADGTIATYKWTYISGPSAYDINTAGASQTKITNLVAGNYIFRLTVTDNGGATANDDLRVNVITSNSNFLPVANAGLDEMIPVGQATVLRGKKSFAPGGYIKSYSWTKVSGPASLEMLSPRSDTTWIRNMTAGAYLFKLTVTDDKDKTAFDEVAITVNGPVTGNLTPLPTGLSANAGRDETIPVGQATVIKSEGSKSASGTITTYKWSKIAGPAQFEMLTPAGDWTWIRNMVAGVYIYRLTIEDNTGASASDEVTINVISGANNMASSGSLSEFSLGSINDGLIIFPNPASNQVNVRWTDSYLGPATINIIDATDVTVKSSSIRKDQYQYTASLDLSVIKPGVYIVEIKMQTGKTIIRKFIKN